MPEDDDRFHVYLDTPEGLYHLGSFLSTAELLPLYPQIRGLGQIWDAPVILPA